MVYNMVMQKKLTLKEVISVVKLSLCPIWCWPLSKDATRFKIFCMKLYHCLCIILTIGLQLPLIYTITNHSDDLNVLGEIIPLIGGICHVICNFVSYQTNYQRIQYVTSKMEHFLKLIKPHEEVIIQQYIDKCIIFHGISLINFYLSTIIVVVTPAVSDKQFPTSAEYPFNVYNQPLKSIIYVHQTMVGFIVTGQLCLNIFMALLIWFASARFEMLTDELRTTTDFHHLVKCIKKHQELLKYAEDVAVVVRPFALTSICCSTISAIVLFLLFINNQSLIIIIQVSGLVIACLAEVFMYTWPAEHLLYTTKDVAQAAFDMYWYNNSFEIWKCLQIIIFRSHKPITISITSIIPSLSLNFFASECQLYLSKPSLYKFNKITNLYTLRENYDQRNYKNIKI